VCVIVLLPVTVVYDRNTNMLQISSLSKWTNIKICSRLHFSGV